MGPLWIYLVTGFVIFVSHVVGAMTGFGNAVFALPLLAVLVGLDVSKAALALLSIVLYSNIAVRERRHVDVKGALTIVAFVGIGMAAGMHLFAVLPVRVSEMALGVFVAAVEAQGLWRPERLRTLPT